MYGLMVEDVSKYFLLAASYSVFSGLRFGSETPAFERSSQVAVRSGPIAI